MNLLLLHGASSHVSGKFLLDGHADEYVDSLLSLRFRELVLSLLKIGRTFNLGSFERNRLPWSTFKSYGWILQEKLSQNCP